MLETSHPQAYYIPPQDVRMDLPATSTRHTYCSLKVEPQAAESYAGWITAAVTGPFKGGPGTRH